MRRADRLFEIIQHLRRQELTRARDLAERLEVSERTIYRDIRDLITSGVPIDGEAGVGYILRAGFEMPPLMFNEREIEALVLGVRIVETWGDSALSQSARDVLAKVEEVIPAKLRSFMADTALLAPEHNYNEPILFDIADVRRALRHRLKISFRYTDSVGDASIRTVRPLSLAYFGPVWVLAAWCELRLDFRTFRLDRIVDFQVQDEVFKDEPGKTLREFLKRDHTWNRANANRGNVGDQPSDHDAENTPK